MYTQEAAINRAGGIGEKMLKTNKNEIIKICRQNPNLMCKK